MKYLGRFLGCGATLLLLVCLIGIVAATGGTPFTPGPLSAEHSLDQPLAGFVTHADFETRCELCHTPFRGPDFARCIQCHTDVRDQMTNAQGLHGQIRNPEDCVACHTDHQGRNVSMTRASPDNFPHNQFGFTLVNHQVDYAKAAITCRTCHSFATQDIKIESANVLAACVECHREKDAQFVADHRRQMGEACLACHDGTDWLKGFQHANVYPLDGKHAAVACVKCHANNVFRGTPKNCVACHADPQVHRGQFGTDCASCHTVTGWTPARLIKHTFPLNHGNKGKDLDCQVCHPTNYATNTCYSCHEHPKENVASEHRQANISDFENCANCHATGKKKE